MQTAYLLDRLSTAYESLMEATAIATELGRDKVIDPARGERLRAIAAEAALIYVAIPRVEG